MFVANDDLVVSTYFYYGPDTFETLSLRLWHFFCKSARGILDIGAFTGIYSLLAKKVGPKSECIAFEPMPHIRNRALLNFTLNGMGLNIALEPYALSDTATTCNFYTGMGPLILDSGGSLLERGGEGSSVSLVQTPLTNIL